LGVAAQPMTARLATNNRSAVRFWFAIYGFTALILTIAVVVFAWLASQSRKEAGEGRTASAPAPRGAHISEARYQALAQFAPPGYVPVPDPKRDAKQSGSAADRQASAFRQTAFRQAMELYSKGDYPKAIGPLRSISEKQPDFAAARYYLGICLLSVGDRPAGVDELKAVVALGQTPYLQGARFFLAKGLLGAGDIGGARREFEHVVELDGDFKPLAQVLLSEIGSPR
jgi:tetratricopeptide (TPR) repeat protein